MRALHQPAAGTVPQLSDLPVPVPAEGTVLLRVKAAGLNPFDNHIASGAMAAMVPHTYPLVLGRDAAGVVEAVGAGVDHVKPGDEVVGHVLFAPPVQAGTLADYALLPAAAVAAKPAALDFVRATTVVDYTRGDVAELVRADHPGGVDALIDLVAHAPDALPTGAVRKGGKVASTLGAATEEALDGHGLTGGNVRATATRDVIAALADQVVAGTLTVDVTTVLPLENAAEGLATIASGTARGKIVVSVAD